MNIKKVIYSPSEKCEASKLMAIGSLTDALALVFLLDGNCQYCHCYKYERALKLNVSNIHITNEQNANVMR